MLPTESTITSITQITKKNKHNNIHRLLHDNKTTTQHI